MSLISDKDCGAECSTSKEWTLHSSFGTPLFLPSFFFHPPLHNFPLSIDRCLFWNWKLCWFFRKLSQLNAKSYKISHQNLCETASNQYSGSAFYKGQNWYLKMLLVNVFWYHRGQESRSAAPRQRGKHVQAFWRHLIFISRRVSYAHRNQRHDRYAKHFHFNKTRVSGCHADKTRWSRLLLVTFGMIEH